MAKAFRIEAGRCTGCQLCVIACKDEHVGNAYPPWTQPQPERGQFWVRVETRERGRQPRVRATHLPLFCQHCENAPCMKVCPEEAIRRRPDGLVWIDPDRCSGCGLCQPACPYEVIYLDEQTRLAQKCTGCAHRVDQGLLPRCVEICPHEVLAFAEAEAEAEADHGWEILRPEFAARPRVRWRGLPHPWICGSVVQVDGEEVVAGAEIIAYDLFTDGTLRAVSDAFGEFWLDGAAAGHKYRLEVRRPGFQPAVRIVTVTGDKDVGDIFLNPA